MNAFVFTTAVHKAYKMLDDEDQRAYVLEMVEDAKAKLDMEVQLHPYVHK